MPNLGNSHAETVFRVLMPRLSDEAMERALARYRGLPFDVDDMSYTTVFVAKFLEDEGEGFAGVR